MFGRILLIFVAISWVACNDISQKFDKEKWKEKEDWDYPFRNEMLNDLTKNHKLTGLSYKQLIDSLGRPENYSDTDGVYYQIVMDFGSDIDPVHTKDLVFKLNRDSVVTGFQIKEWKKD